MTVKEQLEQFAAVAAGGERYTGDAKKIDLLLTYFWLRELMPTKLGFAEFLAQYARVADYDDTNLKHPADAAARWCPRQADKAKQYNLPQWTARQLLQFLSGWVDALEECRLAGQSEPPITFAQFLERVGPQFLSGALTPAPVQPAEKEKRTRKKKDEAAPTPALPGQQQLPFTQPAADVTTAAPPSLAPLTTGIGASAPVTSGQAAFTDEELAAVSQPTIPPSALRPTQAGQRVRVTVPRPLGASSNSLGVVRDIITDNGNMQYVDVQLDDGTLLQNVGITSVQLLPGAVLPQTPTPTYVMSVAVPPDQKQAWTNLLTLTTPVQNTGIIAPDNLLFDPIPLKIANTNKQFELIMSNTDMGPTLEVALVESENELVTTPPRKTLLGDYNLEYQGETYRLTLR